MKKLVRVVDSICFNDKTVLITDPCYLDWSVVPGYTCKEKMDELYDKASLRSNIDFFDNSEWSECWDRNEAIKEQKKEFMSDHGQYIESDTIYGDWSCSVWKGISLNEYLELKTDEVPSNVVKVGKFCADGGMVCVIDASIIDVTKDLKGEDKDYTRCYIPHFTGRASIITIEDFEIGEEDNLNCHVLLESRDGSVYLSTQTGF